MICKPSFANERDYRLLHDGFFFCRRAAVFQILAIWQFSNLIFLQKVESQGKGDNPQHHQRQHHADYCGHDVDGASVFLAFYADHGEQEACQHKDDVADRPNRAYTIRQGDFQKHRNKGCQRQQTDDQRRQTDLLKFFVTSIRLPHFLFFKLCD